MASPSSSAFHHSLLRPVVLQICRATGYSTTKPGTLDLLTDIAGQYMALLAEKVAEHASQNDNTHPSTLDMGMALEDVAAFIPEPSPINREHIEEEDARGMEEFIKWFYGPRNKTIREYAAVDGDPDATDYLSALKKKHSKTGEDSKYHATILGKGNDQGEILIEGGGEINSISAWQKRLHGPDEPASPQQANGDGEPDSRPPSSGLSSVGDRLGDDEMDLS